MAGNTSVDNKHKKLFIRFLQRLMSIPHKLLKLKNSTKKSVPTIKAILIFCCYGIETNDSVSASVVQLAIIIMTHYKRKEVINNSPEIARMLV